MNQKSKGHQARRVSPRARNTTQSKWNSFPNRNVFFGDRPRKAARIDVEQSNLCASQNERLKAFLEINFVMAVNKWPTIAVYWWVDNLIGNDGIQNTMIRNHFCKILQDLHFADNRLLQTFKIMIDHLNSKVSDVLSNDSEQSIDEHMVKLKGRSRMKYIKSKPIKLGLKFWFCCLSKSGYLYQMNMYLRRKKTPEFDLGLGEEVVLQLTKDLERSFCTVFFENFFNCP